MELELAAPSGDHWRSIASRSWQRLNGPLAPSQTRTCAPGSVFHGVVFYVLDSRSVSWRQIGHETAFQDTQQACRIVVTNVSGTGIADWYE